MWWCMSTNVDKKGRPHTSAISFAFKFESMFLTFHPSLCSTNSNLRNVMDRSNYLVYCTTWMVEMPINAGQYQQTIHHPGSLTWSIRLLGGGWSHLPSLLLNGTILIISKLIGNEVLNHVQILRTTYTSLDDLSRFTLYNIIHNRDTSSILYIKHLVRTVSAQGSNPKNLWPVRSRVNISVGHKRSSWTCQMVYSMVEMDQRSRGCRNWWRWIEQRWGTP